MLQVVSDQFQFLGPTVRVAMTGSVMGLNDLGIPTSLNGAALVGLYITAETGGVRWALGGTSPSVAAAIGHVLASAATVWLRGGNIREFEVVDDAGAVSAVLQITPEYEV